MVWLAYVHPAFMVGTLVLALWVLREGLVMRRERLARRPYASWRHRRLARALLLCLAIGGLSGFASMLWLRSGPVAESAHFALALGASVLFVAAAVLGLALERKPESGARDLHAALGALGTLVALGAAAAGMAILP